MIKKNILEINNLSGYYSPSVEKAENFLRIFRRANVKVDAATFDKLVERFKDATTNRGRVGTITNEALRGKITGGNMFDLSKSGSFKGNIMREIESKFATTFTDKYHVSDLQITIIKSGAAIDVSPYLIIK